MTNDSQVEAVFRRVETGGYKHNHPARVFHRMEEKGRFRRWVGVDYGASESADAPPEFEEGVTPAMAAEQLEGILRRLKERGYKAPVRGAG